jgi:NAD(P)H-flavin reductase
MSSAKNATAAKKNAKENEKPVKARDAAARSGAPAGKRATVPAQSAGRVSAKSEAQVPAKSEAKLPVKKETQLPAARAEVPARAAGAPAGAGLGENPYLPEVATVAERIQETALIVTLRLVLDDPAKMKNFTFEPGQVGQLSVFGAGESTFVINSPPSQKDYLQMSCMKAGEVTSAIHKLAAGDKVGLRAPLGNSFPYAQWKGKDVFFVGGGIGMAPIRTIMLHLLDNRKDYGKISLLYGARSPKDMAYSYELDNWLKNLDTTLTIDAPFESWKHKVGLIPNVLLELAPNPKNCVVVLCGPPIMIKFTLQALQKLAFPDEQIVTTLEKRMKCGIGVCGRCNIGHKYVCVDGPVFSLAELKELPDEL